MPHWYLDCLPINRTLSLGKSIAFKSRCFSTNTFGEKRNHEFGKKTRKVCRSRFFSQVSHEIFLIYPLFLTKQNPNKVLQTDFQEHLNFSFVNFFFFSYLCFSIINGDEIWSDKAGGKMERYETVVKELCLSYVTVDNLRCGLKRTWLEFCFTFVSFKTCGFKTHWIPI